ncbi:hypothetical protein SAMN05216436_12031 [bacterium A37T11]|nr:hypothetical protein SAMN05216436_12031 [bacterium A37T11]
MIPHIIVDIALLQLVTGKGPKQCRRDLKEMKEKLNKEKHQYVTLREYSRFSGIPLEELVELRTAKKRP